MPENLTILGKSMPDLSPGASDHASGSGDSAYGQDFLVVFQSFDVFLDESQTGETSSAENPASPEEPGMIDETGLRGPDASDDSPIFIDTDVADVQRNPKSQNAIEQAGDAAALFLSSSPLPTAASLIDFPAMASNGENSVLSVETVVAGHAVHMTSTAEFQVSPGAVLSVPAQRKGHEASTGLIPLSASRNQITGEKAQPTAKASEAILPNTEVPSKTDSLPLSGPLEHTRNLNEKVVDSKSWPARWPIGAPSAERWPIVEYSIPAMSAGPMVGSRPELSSEALQRSGISAVFNQMKHTTPNLPETAFVTNSRSVSEAPARLEQLETGSHADEPQGNRPVFPGNPSLTAIGGQLPASPSRLSVPSIEHVVRPAVADNPVLTGTSARTSDRLQTANDVPAQRRAEMHLKDAKGLHFPTKAFAASQDGLNPIVVSNRNQTVSHDPIPLSVSIGLPGSAESGVLASRFSMRPTSGLAKPLAPPPQNSVAPETLSRASEAAAEPDVTGVSGISELSYRAKPNQIESFASGTIVTGPLPPRHDRETVWSEFAPKPVSNMPGHGERANGNEARKPPQTVYTIETTAPIPTQPLVVAPKMAGTTPELVGEVASGTAPILQQIDGPVLASAEHVLRSEPAMPPDPIRPMRPADSARDIARQMAPSLPTGDLQVELGLSPKELGHVRMSLSVSETGVNLVVTAERMETIDLMRRHAEEMSAAFRDLGYENIAFSFGSGTNPGKSDTSEGLVPSAEDVEPDRQPDIETNSTGRTDAPGGLDLRL